MLFQPFVCGGSGHWGIRLLTVTVLLSLMGSPALALRKDPGEKPFQIPATPPSNNPAGHPPTAGQRTAAAIGRKLGVKVEWHSASGLPASIRGADLGQRKAFSGGKGLPLRGGGAVREDSIAVLDNLAAFYRIRDAEKEFAAAKVAADSLGFRHVRVAQMHRGLKVVGGGLTVHFDKKGQAYEVNGRYVPDIEVEVAPKISAEQALRIAQEDLFKLGLPPGKPGTGAGLVVFARHTAPQLAFELTLSYSGPKAGPGRWRYWIDAVQGKILMRFNDIQHIAPPTIDGANATIIGSILAGEGGVSTNVTGWHENTGIYYLYNTNWNWSVYNVAASGYPDASTYAHRATNDWAETDRAEMSIAHGFNLIQQYYSQIHGLNSFDGSGAFARANVHEGIDYVNAYWDGSEFYFGDGDGEDANCLAVLDIAGHEFTHAVTQYSADLIYYAEPGALNESFSDILGCCIEFYGQADDRASYPARNPAQADWLCGEDSWLASTALRDLRNPANSATVGFGNEQPTRYNGTYWYNGTGDNGGVHQNSGVQNFFFYLLCEGGSGNNDGITYSVSGIGITNAEQVAYRALTVYCTPDTDYHSVRAAWLSAAGDLNPAWIGAVRAAWDAVGIQAVSVTPESGVAFVGPVGGPFSPATFIFSVNNMDSSTADWGVSHSQAWVGVEPEGGSLPAFGSQSVTVTVNGAASALPSGTYADTVAFTNSASSVCDNRSVTLQVLPPVVYEFTLDTDPGWTTEGQWEYGTPSGSGGDPSSGATGAKVYGYNLSGPYSNNMPIFALTTPAIDCSRYDDVQLSFERWLGVESANFDHATIQISTNGTEWVDVWNHTGASFQDTSWRNFVYSLPMAAGQGSVYLRWLMGPTDGSVTYSGWNIDDIRIHGTARDAMGVTPGGLVSQGYEGGPFSPTSQTFVVVNSGSNTFDWTAGTTSTWFSVVPSEGSLIAGATTTVTVALNPGVDAFAPGRYAGVALFSNLMSGFSSPRAVSLTVWAIPGEIVVWDSLAPHDDRDMPFGPVLAGLSRTESVTVTNTDAVHPLVLNGIGFGVYQENFDDGLAQDWDEDVDDDWTVVSGEYQAQAVSDAWMISTYRGKAWDDVAAQMTCRRTGDDGYSAALIIRATPDFDDETGSGYVFQIAANGSYGIWKQVDGNFSWIQEWTASSAIQPDINCLRATAQGNALSFTINGVSVWNGSDASLSGGRIGVGGYTDGSVTHYFDDVMAGEALPPSAAAGKIQTAPTVDSGMAVSGMYRLTNGPASFPYSIPAQSAITFDVVYAPTVQGSNTATLVIESNDADEPKIEVALSGEGMPDYLDIQPATGLSGMGHPGGPFTPSQQAYVVSNTAPGDITWSVCGAPSWVAVTPSSGALSAGMSATIQVEFNAAAAALPEGVYNGELVFSNLTTTITQKRPVALEVYTSPTVLMAPAAITVTNRMGQSQQAVLQVGNAASADAVLDFSLSASETARPPSLAPAFSSGVHNFVQVPKGAAYQDGELLVRFSKAAAGSAVRAQTLAAAGGGQVTREFTLVPGLTVVKLPEGTALTDALARFNQTPGILYAQPNYQHKALRTPNDPQFSQLWGLHNTGQTGGTPGVDIDAPEAWERGVGGGSVVVAVIDTGVDYNHEDLAANMWTNPGEVPGNGIDDDGNGYVDDVHGYDVVNGDGDPMDDNDHGTHCAGTIGGVGNNGLGVAGVCWNVKIMALKFLSASGSGNTAHAIGCIEYAVQMGAKVLNNSWGGGPYEQALKDAIDAAGAADVLFVAAAGNDYGNDNDMNPSYPASYESDNIISVMSVDAFGAMSSFSNFGEQSVDLAAPGSAILSCKRGGGYVLFSGTSMATPHVVGACALLRSLNGGLSCQQVKDALVSTTDASLPGRCVSGGLMKLAAAVAAVPSWLRVDPFSGANVEPGAWSNIAVTVDAGALAAGTYAGSIGISCNDRGTPVTNVPVAMVVVQDDLGIYPAAGFEPRGYTGGPFSPSNWIYKLTNTGAASLTWSARAGQEWITVSPAGGTLASGHVEQVSVSLGASAASLAPGDYSGDVVFSNMTSLAVQHRGVSLAILERSFDHFAWDWMASTQRAGHSIPVRLRAEDQTGQALVGFTQSVGLGGFANASSVSNMARSDFEVGRLAGWTVTNLGVSGSWCLSRNGMSTPISGHATSLNAAGGGFYAVADMGGPCTLVMMMSFTVPAGPSPVVLEFDLYANDWSGSGPLVNPDGLSYLLPSNQHARVDILIPEAEAFDTGSAVLTNLYLGVDAGAPPNPYTHYSFDITSLVGTGGTFVLRFAEVCNMYYLNTGVDNIRLYSGREMPVAITPTNACFVDGVCTAGVTILAPATNVTLRANDGAGHVADSGAFDVVAGLPSDWLMQYRLALDGTEDFIDSDHDGMDNWEEWLAGTVPTNWSSKLQFTHSLPGPAGTNFVVCWSSVTGKLYAVDAGTNLAEGFPITVSNNIPATPDVNILTIRVDRARQEFFRIRIQP